MLVPINQICTKPDCLNHAVVSVNDEFLCGECYEHLPDTRIIRVSKDVVKTYRLPYDAPIASYEELEIWFKENYSPAFLINESIEDRKSVV